MKITSLLENTACSSEVEAEHGLSLYIETENRKILFDMGQTTLFASNAEALGISLGEVDMAVLSHGHYDHGGGLAKFLEINSKAPVYINRDAFLPHYNGTEKYIGLDTFLADSQRIIFVGDECRIGDGLTLFSCNGNERKYTLGGAELTEKVGERFIPDDFRHEQYLLIEEDGKRTLISGCSHKGILNIVEWFTPDILVGGFHFSKLPLDDILTAAAQALDAYPTEYYTCHCTGIEQYEFMKSQMKRLNYLSCGESIVI